VSITFTQRINEINIEYTNEPMAMEILYSGTFAGEVLGNTVTGMNNKKIIIVFLSPPEETLMIYKGNFNISQIKAYNKNQELIEVNRNIITDDIENIRSKWEESTMKYENYNESNKYYPRIEHIIASTLNDEKRYANVKGNITEDKLRGNQKRILNRIRGNYGVK